MSHSLLGKNAVVTGGTRGIGFEIARKLLQNAASVVLCGRSQEGVERAVTTLHSETQQNGGKVTGCPADISVRNDVAALFQFADANLDGLDILVNNAGIGVFRNIADLDPDEWRRVLDTNLTGAFLCSREAVPRMRNRGSGFIVNISSLAGKNPFAGGTAYNSSKFALNGFSEAMMLDLRYDNIRVSSVMPGSVSTEFARGGTADWKIAPEDIADMVMAVLSMPARTLVSAVEIRPSRPLKK